MHELLKHVLTERDLTRAGDIFAIPDSDIVDDLNEVVSCCLRFSQFIIVLSTRISLKLGVKVENRLNPVLVLCRNYYAEY